MTPPPSGRTSPDIGAVLTSLGTSFRRFWPVYGLIAYGGLFDERINGDPVASALIGLVAAAPFYLESRVRPLLAALTKNVPERFRTIVLVGVPVGVLYLTRWHGTQDGGLALVTAGAPLALGLVVAANRERVSEALGPFYSVRDRYVPRVVRIVLVFVVPTFLTFAIAHGSLGDIGALLGGQTTQAASAADHGLRIVVATVLSGAAAFVLLDEPARRGGGVAA